jgi:hypothetical protein
VVGATVVEVVEVVDVVDVLVDVLVFDDDEVVDDDDEVVDDDDDGGGPATTTCRSVGGVDSARRRVRSAPAPASTTLARVEMIAFFFMTLGST